MKKILPSEYQHQKMHTIGKEVQYQKVGNCCDRLDPAACWQNVNTGTFEKVMGLIGAWKTMVFLTMQIMIVQLKRLQKRRILISGLETIILIFW